MLHTTLLARRGGTPPLKNPHRPAFGLLPPPRGGAGSAGIRSAYGVADFGAPRLRVAPLLAMAIGPGRGGLAPLPGPDRVRGP